MTHSGHFKGNIWQGTEIKNKINNNNKKALDPNRTIRFNFLAIQLRSTTGIFCLCILTGKKTNLYMLEQVFMM